MSGVIQAARMGSYFQKCWCASILARPILCSLLLLAIGFNILPGLAQTVDAELYYVAALEINIGLHAQAHSRVCSSGDHVTRQQGHEPAGIGDQKRYIEYQVGRRAVLHLFPI